MLLRAGLEGIKSKLKAPAPVEENVFEFDDAKLAKHYITKLPANLGEALTEIEKGTIVRQAFGEYTWKRYLEAKHQEWDSFRRSVIDWEIERYFESI